jgi:hypothetical protein
MEKVSARDVNQVTAAHAAMAARMGLRASTVRIEQVEGE